MRVAIKGIKLVRLNTQGINLPDDPSFGPWRLDAVFRPTEFMPFTFLSIHGPSENLCVRGKTKEALEEFVTLNQLRQHPRLSRLEIVYTEEAESDRQARRA